MKIQNEASKTAYAVAKQVYDGKITLTNGVATLVKEHSLNRNTAADYIRILACMIDGEKYTRTNNLFSTNYFLEQIHNDYGNAGLRNALESLMLHIEYYEALRSVNMNQLREIHAKYAALVEVPAPAMFPDEVPEEQVLFEGAVKKVTVNVCERNPVARELCIEHYGCKCFVCGMDFGKAYGKIGQGFIHVHHLVEVASIKAEYVIDPIKDLRPLCPNCHAMIHRENPALTIEALAARLNSQQ